MQSEWWQVSMATWRRWQLRGKLRNESVLWMHFFVWCHIAEQAAVMQSLSTRQALLSCSYIFLSALMQPATVGYTFRHCHYCTHVDQTLSSNDLFFKSQKINSKIYFYCIQKQRPVCEYECYFIQIIRVYFQPLHFTGIFFYDWLDISCTFHSAWDYSHTQVMRMTGQEGSKQRRAAFNSLSSYPRLSSDPLFPPFVSIVFTTFLSFDLLVLVRFESSECCAVSLGYLDSDLL